MRRRVAISLVVLITAAFTVWFQKWSLDGLAGVVLTALLREDTAYAEGYTDRSFRAIRVGMAEQQVQTALGSPLGVSWSYGTAPSRCRSVHFRNGRVTSWTFDECQESGIQTGMPMDRAGALLGPPLEVYWLYSESPSDTHYRERVVRFSSGRVNEVISGWYLD